jgi:hypothetical protein
MAAHATDGSRHWDTVAVGDVVPGFELPITAKTILLAAAGTRDYMPYHHNREFCHGVGVRDAFVNTTYNQALLSRGATDWSGPDVVVRSMTLQMTDQLCLGDTAQVGGVVTKKFEDDGHPSVELDLTISADGRQTARAAIVLRLPAAGEMPAARVMGAEPPAVEIAEDIPDAMRDQLDRRIVRHAPFPVSEAQIGYWCDMVRDGNARYSRAGEDSGAVMAPEASLSIWNLVRAGQLGVTATAPDVDAPEQPAWPEAIDSDWPFEFRAPGAKEVIVQRRHLDFGAPIRVGDAIRSTVQLLNCSGLRTTKLGQGYFLSRYEVYQNQDDEVVGSTLMSVFQYGVDADAVKVGAGGAGKN